MSNLDLTVIIPVHSVSDNKFTDMFKKAIDSIAANKIKPAEVMIVRCACDEVKAVIDSYEYGDLPVRIVENPNSKSFQSQMNYGVSQATTKYVTYLEFDDTYGEFWFESIKEHVEAYPDTEMFVPLVIELNNEGKRLHYSNAEAWAMSFSDEMGVFTHDSLTSFTNVNICGMVINREFYQKIGGLKTNIEIFFPYEFILRVTHKGGRLQVIPHEGYRHVNGREGSLFWSYKNDDGMKINTENAELWMHAARTEFYFADDREVDLALVSKNLEESNDEKSTIEAAEEIA